MALIATCSDDKLREALTKALNKNEGEVFSFVQKGAAVFVDSDNLSAETETALRDYAKGFIDGYNARGELNSRA